MGFLGALVGGTVGFILGGPLGGVLGGTIGAIVGDPSPEQLGTRPVRIFGRCPSCMNKITFSEDEELKCPHCGTYLQAPGIGRGAGSRGRARGSTGGPFGGPFGGGGAAGGAGGAGGRSAGQTHYRTHDATQGTTQSAFMIALISLAAKVAKADGQVSKQEIRTFDAFLMRDLGMSIQERRLAAQIFNEARDSRLPASAFARQLRGIMAGQPDRLRDLVSLLLKIAWADGRLDKPEERLIRSIASDLGLSQRDYDEASALFSRGDLRAAYALLGIEPTATEQEIKKSYRRLASEYHPDKLASKGLPEDFTKYANEKLQAINEAYEMIRKKRGF